MENHSPDAVDVQKNKGMAVIAYIIFFVPLLVAKDSAFAKYHANQGLILLICAVALNFVLGIIPFLGWFLLPFANLAVFVFAILGIINAANGLMKPLPYIGEYTLIK